jgi:AcrR family transcriptional regulator
MRKPQPPRKQPRQARSRFLVDTIIEAAARVFEAHGYDQTTTNRIAEVAGVSIGSIYQYFPNKDALITALHEHHLLEVLALVRSAIDESEGRTLLQSVASMVAACAAHHRERPCLQQLLHAEHPTLERRDSDAGRRIVEATVRLLERHRAEIRQPDLQVAAFVVLRMFEELIHASVIDPPPHASDVELERAITEAVVGFLRGSERAAE